jgi:hypothetical protein
MLKIVCATSLCGWLITQNLNRSSQLPQENIGSAPAMARSDSIQGYQRISDYDYNGVMDLGDDTAG